MLLRRVLLGLALHASVVDSLPPEAVRPSQECRMVGVDCDRDPAAKRALRSTTMLLNVGNEEDPCRQPVPPMLPAADPSYSSDEHDHLLVISRYDERLDWIAELLEERSWIKNVLIINKGDPVLAPLPEDKVIIRDARNVGREGETLLHYIIQDYDRLPETLWFMQADPFTHQPQAKRLFDPEVVALYNRTFQPLTMQFAEYARIPESLLAAEETQLNGMVRQVYLQAATGGIKFATGLDEDDPIARSYGVLGFTNILDQMQEEHKVELRQQTVRKVCNYLGITEIEQSDALIPYTMSAMFAVSGKAIKRYPKKFYENVRRWLIYEDESGQEQVQKAPLGNGVDTCNYLRQGGKRGYLLERLWQYMFTGHQRRPVA